MINRCLELQKIVIKAITDIDFLKQNNIKIFSSVPDEAKMPYIKLELLKMESVDFANNLQRFTITFFIATKNPNNQQLIEIVEVLHNDLPSKIKVVASIENKIKIFNVVNVNYNIKENLQNSGWFGEFTMSLDIK